MLPPIINNINSEILTLYTSPNGNNEAPPNANNSNGRPARGRYAEIGVRRSDVFLEPYLNNHNSQQQQGIVVSTGTTASLVDNLPNSSPLPADARRQLSQLHHVQSEGSLSSDNSGTSSGGASSTEEDSGGGCEGNGGNNGVGGGTGANADAACNITLIERLIRSHPIWFLPGIQRAGAFHLLQGKEEGNFVVRQSSQSDTMALSVRLPTGKGPYIEHYLIQANKGKLSLETSENRFDNIPSLIAHYCTCCDELPVQLTLPRAMREAKNRQQLSSLALLGQEFWRYPMANPKPPESASSSSNTSSLSSFHGGNNSNNNLSTPPTESIVLNLTPIIPKDSPNTSPSNTIPASTFSCSGPRQTRPTPPNTLNLTTFNEPLESRRDINKLSPNDKLSQRLVSPNLVQNLVRSPSPVVQNVDANVLSPLTDTKSEFTRGSQFTSSNTSITSNFHRNIATGFNDLNIKSPDVVQVGSNLKSPPPPPPRWAKPVQSQSQTTFNVATTVTLSLNQNGDLNNTVQSTPSDTPLLSPQSASSNKSLTSKSSSAHSTTPILSPSSKLVSNGNRIPQVLSPSALSNSGKSSRRRRERDARKNSQHYQESDILESYCRSSPADKISDYEDIWNTNDLPHKSAKENQTKNCSEEQAIRNRMNENNRERILSPGECKIIRTEQLVVQTNEKLIIRSDRTCASEKFSYKEITSPEFTSFKPLQEVKSQETTPSPEDTRKRPDLLSRVCSANSLNSPINLTPPRNKLGLMLASARSESNSPMTPDSKQGSPFYAEPADAIPRPALSSVARRRPKPVNSVTSRFRHSEPGWLQTQLAGGCHHTSVLHSIDWDESEETEEKTPLISSSVDNLAKRLSGKEVKRGLPAVAKPVQPPKIKPKIFSDTSWAVDSSWEFIGNDADGCEPDYDCDTDCDGDNVGGKFPDDEQDNLIVRNTLTAQSIILQRYPELFKSPDTTESLYSDRNSSYDNVERRQNNHNINYHTNTMSTTSTTTTTVSTTTTAITTLDLRQSDRVNNYDQSESETILDTDVESDVERIKRNRSCKERFYPLLSAPGLCKLRRSSEVGTAIRAYALQLAADKSTTFSQNIENFIQCTKESKESSPQVVMRNMRQFMSGMKNYLVKHGEREFEKEVEKERLKLKANEFLNLDHILEDVMMFLVVKPLREHVYQLFVDSYMADGSLKMLADSIQIAQSKTIYDFGVQPKILPPIEANIVRIQNSIRRLQKADSPLEKLDHLLDAISTVYNTVRNMNSNKVVLMGADDLLPLVIWILARCQFVDAEIESEFMWGLIHPSQLSGEGGYYLTTLSSAVQILKNLKCSQGTISTINGCGTPDCSSVLRVLVPDELHGSLNTRTLPVRPNMNTRDICRILAHKIRCTNPQDYGLFKLVQGEETLLGDQECPQELSHCLFAYKRIDAKIAWPKSANPMTPTMSSGNGVHS